jgi:chemotaxis protein methyltransferase CheR
LLIDKISTNHTFFFREKDHFEYLSQKVLPQMVKQKNGTQENLIRIWCAGCSSGEESYTIAMVLQEFFGPDISLWDLGILASDISTTVLEQAMRGVYNPDRVKEVSPLLRQKYFHVLPDGNLEVDKVLRKHILFKRLNLMQDAFPFKHKFDIIFCRNVMIYFDAITRKTLVEKMGQYMRSGAYLFIGHSETLGRDMPGFQYVQPALYIRK